MRICLVLKSTALVVAAAFLGACSNIPSAGPRASQVESTRAELSAKGIELIDINAQVVKQLASRRASSTFSEAFGNQAPAQKGLGPGDVLDVTVWEAPPAALFGGLQAEGLASAGGQSIALPSQVIDSSGGISVPFVGRIQATGLSTEQLGVEIARRLRGKANQPQVLVRLAQNQTSFITVVSDGGGAVRVPFTPKAERLLDALTSAGAAHQSLDKLTVQIVRGNQIARMPFARIIDDPRQNIPLFPGDTIAVLYQPNTFTALGATGKNDEISFEAPGISLAQALARTGGLNDNRADPRGVFVFRMEGRMPSGIPDASRVQPADDKVPVIYRIDLTDPGSYFIARSFMIDDKDIVYVANAPIADLQKFLNVLFSVAYPIVNSVNSFK
ncbi:polysaccharide biosynthesis/export family protein [Paraburkholderia nemoris]|jgi:Periplasmic protein involved in polysaccharide export|uniref:polysaccharide biosynthesis/export family protein n=1 Tax=Paraburkholderia nemoris TaxID=2793076 RepID=UPI001B8CFA90|nr:polysaccharide biosynthesis/export family protein [Paraburkholderia nemoris]